MKTGVTLQSGKIYRTSDGSKVRIYSTDDTEFNQAHGAHRKYDNSWEISTWYLNGQHPSGMLSITMEWDDDYVPKPPPKINYHCAKRYGR